MTEEKRQKLNEVHAVDKVYKTVAGGNDEITFDAFVGKDKIPVNTVNHNRMESHYVFKKADETEANE